MAVQQASIEPHRILTHQGQGPSITMGPLTGMATAPVPALRPVAQQRIPTALAAMIASEQKQKAGRPGIVRRRNG